MRRARPDLLNGLVQAVDRAFRRIGGIREFSDDPECLFRLSLGKARRRASFQDGTVVLPGEPLGILHLWAEHMPVIPGSGPDLVWASQTIRAARRSFGLLAIHISDQPGLQDLKAYGNDAFFMLTGQSSRPLLGIGFALVEEVPAESAFDRWRTHAARHWAWLLRRAFNQRSVSGLRPRDLRRHSLWVSRRELLEKYVSPAPEAG
ncbi:MAG: hypothetical protein FJW35_01465 [Acidobacteria bacterium]|nr:hypothetical protein [Acidobacteriota bacterium]